MNRAVLRSAPVFRTLFLAALGGGQVGAAQ